MFESQPSFWIKIEMNSTIIIGYGWHLHISVISLHEAVQMYWHRLNTLNGVTWNICRGYILQLKINVKSVSAKRKSTSVVLISLEFFSVRPTFEIFSVLDGKVVFANLWPQGFVRVSFKQSEISRFFLSLNLVWMSKNVLSSVCLSICKTKLTTLTEWTVSGPEGGIAITPVANTEYHPLLEGSGATGCGIDTWY